MSAAANTVSLASHLPVLQVAVPLIAAPIAFILGSLGAGESARRTSAEVCWWFTFAVSVAILAISGNLAATVMDGTVLSYELGGWAAPWGIEYRIDSVAAVALLIVSGINLITLLYAKHAVVREVPERIRGLFYTAWLLCVTGMLGICATGDIFNVFVFLEISSLSSYILISSGRDRLGLLAAYRYLILGTIGATFFLIGVGLLYGLTGTLNMADIATRLPALAGNQTLIVAFGFLAIGIAVKMALFPLHAWMPEAYTHAPSPVSALLAGTATKVAVYLMIRTMYTVFGVELAFDAMMLGVILITLSTVAVFFGSLAAIFQHNAKKIMAWSSVAQIGYMGIGAGLATVTGLTAAMLHMYNHALMKAALFMALGCLFWRIGSMQIDKLAGMGKRMPWTFSAFVLGGLSLIGVPLTAGFVSKWYLILGVLEQGWWWLAVLIVISSLMAVIYIAKLVETMWFREPAVDAPTGEAPLWLLLPTWALVILNFVFGIYTALPVGVARSAATALMGGN